MIQTKPTSKYIIPEKPQIPQIRFYNPENIEVKKNFSCISPSHGQELSKYLKSIDLTYEEMAGIIAIVNGD